MFSRNLTASLAICLLVATGFVRQVRADSPRVTAVLSSSQTMVGEMVQMQVRVTGARGAKVPTQIAVDGLEIRQTGTSQSIEMRGLDMTATTTYTYTILPLKPGAFTIPAQKIEAGSSSLTTPELRLVVGNSPYGSNARPGTGIGSGTSRNNAQAQPGNLASAELLIPKKTAYVGEMIPVVIRLTFFTDITGIEPPQFAVQGFTTEKLQVPDRPQMQTIDGRPAQVISYKTAIAATRPGKFEIGPIKTTANMLVPRQQTNQTRRRSPFDMMEDPFADFFNPMGRMRQEQREIVTEAVSLEVKSLPPNAPPSFSGAIGNFTMTSEANPKTVQMGDPITVTSKITGRGNFDRMNAPVLEDENGWHKYPPSSKFKQDDEVGISGEKTFDLVISPNEKKQAISPLLFSYFDPTKEQYVTLKSDPVPIKVEGGAAPAATAGPTAPPAIASASKAPASVAPTATPAAAPQQDILYQMNDAGKRAESFAPLYQRPIFWGGQLIPLIGLLSFIGWKMRQQRLQDRAALRAAALQHEAADLVRSLRRDGVSPQEYYTRASRAVRIKTALAMKMEPDAVDAADVSAAFHLDGTSQQRLLRLFERSDELKYSGGHNGAGTIAPEQRAETLELIESLR